MLAANADVEQQPGPDLARWPVDRAHRERDDGAVFPRLRGDGKELFYYAADGRLMAVPIKGDTAFEAGTAVPLFGARMLNGPNIGAGFRPQYDVTRDGQRFLLNVLLEEAAPSSITVVLDWTIALSRR